MSDCDVCIGGYDGDVQFFFANPVTCRKPAKCGECGRTIEKGEIYHRVGGKCEGDMWSMKVCLLCDEIGNVFACGHGRSYGNLWEMMQDNAFPLLTTASPCFTNCSAAAKAEVIRRWREWKGLGDRGGRS